MGATGSAGVYSIKQTRKMILLSKLSEKIYKQTEKKGRKKEKGLISSRSFNTEKGLWDGD